MHDYLNGYNAAALCEPYNKDQTQDWQRGWMQYYIDMDRTENARWI